MIDEIIKALTDLVRTRGTTLAKAEAELRTRLRAQKVSIDVRPARPGHTHLRTVVGQTLTVHVTCDVKVPCDDDDPDVQAHSQSVKNSSDLAPASLNGHEPILERVIRVLDTQSSRRSFMWVGFVINELMPTLGVEGRQAQLLFDRLRDEGLIALGKRPNPNNPNYPTTTVDLVREHPVVRRILSDSHSKRFEPIAIRGEAASATLIRERR